MAGRAAVAVGGATVGTVTYYSHKVSDWTEQVKNDTQQAFYWLGQTLSGLVSAASSAESPSDEQQQQQLEVKEESMANPFTRLLMMLMTNDSNLLFKVHHAQPAPVQDGSTVGGNYFMQALTRRMLEVKSILKTVSADGGSGGQSDPLWLPSIVVIGSQSSGKSSLLESLVGQEFLPKGTNMVTRRPIEITLVHSPNAGQQYAEFPKQGLRQITDFSRVQRIIAELNASVPASECVSDDPIDLRIYSPNVPDLTLIDLPGYIALHNRQQPPELKQKIVALCQRYIQPQNIILAVSAADVDLANSEALNESRAVDPDGTRTLGVLTKMDLVSPQRGAALLRNEDYPLQLGYIGVICGGADAAAGNNSESGGALQKYQRQAIQEERFFRLNASAYDSVLDRVGTATLRRSLMSILELRLQESLESIAERVRSELEDVRYQFKVHFNDRHITAEAYIAEVIDGLKQGIRQLSLQFSRPNLREEVMRRLDERAMDICMQEYWTDERLPQAMTGGAVPSTNDSQLQPVVPQLTPAVVWQRKLDASHATFTKSGVGKVTTQGVVEAVMGALEQLVIRQTQLSSAHPQTAKRIMSIANEIIRRKLFSTIDQVENTIKPLKYDVEFNRNEWTDSLQRSLAVMERELRETKQSIDEVKRVWGRRKIRSAIQYLDAVDKIQQQQQQQRESPLAAQQHPQPAANNDNEEDSSINQKQTSSQQLPPVHFSPQMLEKAREVRELQQKADRLSGRLAIIRPGWLYSSPCAAKFILSDPSLSSAASLPITQPPSPSTQSKPQQQSSSKKPSPSTTTTPDDMNNRIPRLTVCPEPYLLLLSEKLTQTAVMFIWFELLNEFFYLLPREIDNHLYYNLSHNQIVEFANENPAVQAHLRLQEKKDALELAMEKLSFAVRTQQQQQR